VSKDRDRWAQDGFSDCAEVVCKRVVCTCELIIWGEQGHNLVLQVSSIDGNKTNVA
jgi:hypothetical protein